MSFGRANTMKRTIASACIALLLMTTAALAVEFSADQVVKAKGMGSFDAKINFTEKKWRTEANVAGQHTISIVRTDKNVTWVLMPEEKMYMENKIDPSQRIATSKKMTGEIKREKLGRESVNGINCEKSKITYKEGTKTASVYLWLSDDGLPVKSEAADGSWSSEMKNIKKGPQAASLFEIPAGYTKMSAPGAGSTPGKMDMDSMKKMMEKYGR